MEASSPDPGRKVATVRVSVPLDRPGCSTSPQATAGRESPPELTEGSQSSIRESRTTCLLRWVACFWVSRPDFGCTKGRSGSPVEVTRRTVSPYCRIETCRPDQVVLEESSGWLGSEMSRSRIVVPPNPPGHPGPTRSAMS